MTALWCVLGFKLVRNRIIGERVARYGHLLLPFVLMMLGLHVLNGACTP